MAGSGSGCRLCLMRQVAAQKPRLTLKHWHYWRPSEFRRIFEMEPV